MNLPITALVVTSLDCDILGGVPFCQENDIGVHLKDEEFSLHGKRLSYGAKPKQVQNIFRVESVLLRNDTDKVVMPGEFELSLPRRCSRVTLLVFNVERKVEILDDAEKEPLHSF